MTRSRVAVRLPCRPLFHSRVRAAKGTFSPDLCGYATAIERQGSPPCLPEGLVILEKLSVKIANAAAQAIRMPDRFELKERVDVTCPVCGGTFTLR